MTEEHNPDNCPFCRSADTKCLKNPAREYQVVCFKCYANGPTKQTEIEAIAAWNLRVEPDELPKWFIAHLKFNIESNRSLLKKRKDLDVIIDNTKRDALENEIRWMSHFLSLRREDGE